MSDSDIQQFRLSSIAFILSSFQVLGVLIFAFYILSPGASHNLLGVSVALFTFRWLWPVVSDVFMETDVSHDKF